MEISQQDITRTVAFIVTNFAGKSTTANDPQLLELHQANAKANLRGIAMLGLPDSVSQINENIARIDELYGLALLRIDEQKQTSDLGRSPVA